ncbi:ATP synthase F1 subunit epsilon [Patescibacteria group bacterium]|nr:ATP synthase F1 subunit epsilon [Patescibacteria group bacterium]
MNKISLKIVTPEKVVFEDAGVDSVSTMTQSGEVTILPGHIPMVSNLQPGEARYKKDGEEFLLAHSTGFLEVRGGNQVVILADTAERVEELELEKIEAAKEQARRILTEKRNIDEVAFADASAMMERELARERVAKKKYRKLPNQLT